MELTAIRALTGVCTHVYLQVLQSRESLGAPRKLEGEREGGEVESERSREGEEKESRQGTDTQREGEGEGEGEGERERKLQGVDHKTSVDDKSAITHQLSLLQDPVNTLQ